MHVAVSDTREVGLIQNIQIINNWSLHNSSTDNSHVNGYDKMSNRAIIVASRNDALSVTNKLLMPTRTKSIAYNFPKSSN